MSSFGDAIQKGPIPIEEALRRTTILHTQTVTRVMSHRVVWSVYRIA